MDRSGLRVANSRHSRLSICATTQRVHGQLERPFLARIVIMNVSYNLLSHMRQKVARAPTVHGKGESSAAFQHNPARCLPDELPEQPNLPPAVPSPRERVRVRGIGWPFDTATR